jgi:hypothetical protein
MEEEKKEITEEVKEDEVVRGEEVVGADAEEVKEEVKEEKGE